uniref:Nucleotide-diphospho-sugar transferase domain-containing protein n=2 Tax=Oryza TaxID=4527 RepID=A0A0E0GG93_ORYNI
MATADEVGGGGGGGGAGVGAGDQVRRAKTAALFLAAVALPCLVLYRAAVSPAGLFLRPAALPAPPRGDVDPVNSEDARLERVLRAAAMANGTVILTTLNSAWAEPGSVVDVFLESFRIGDDTRWLLDHLVMVSLDLTAHRRCLQIHRHCFALTTDDGFDFSGEKNFMTDGYLKMMWRRIDFLGHVLAKGYSFIFTDTDIVWFRNPLPHLHHDGDFQIACDHFTGDPDDLSNSPNGGFAYVRSTSATAAFYRYWYAARERHPGLHDQDVLNLIKRDAYVARLGVRIRFLSTDLFAGLCEHGRNLSTVCTMHANCCVGLRRKVDDLGLMLQDWRRFMATPGSDRDSVTWSVPRNCSMKKLGRLEPTLAVVCTIDEMLTGTNEHAVAFELMELARPHCHDIPVDRISEMDMNSDLEQNDRNVESLVQ